MPDRWVRKDAITSRAVNHVSWQAEVFWRRLINTVDDFGRYTADPDILLAHVFPLQLSKVRVADIPRLLLECEQAGLLFRYSAEGKDCLVLNKWERGRAKKSKFPDPPEDICKQMQTLVYVCKQMSPSPTPTTTTEVEREKGRTTSIPTVEEVIARGGMIGLTEQECRDWHRDMTAAGWADRHGADVGNWASYLVGHRNRLRQDHAKGQTKNHRNPRPSSSRNDGTFNNPSDYA